MQAWQYAHPVENIRIDDSTQIAYTDTGQGQPLLFIHGLGSNLQCWNRNIDSLASKYRCLAIDLPGYGKSSKQSYPFTMSFFAHSVQTFIDSLGLDQVTVIGHSMGGQIAMHMALSRPEQISRLVLLAPAGFETFSSQERQLISNLYSPAIVKALPTSQIVKNFELNFYDMPEDAKFMIEDRLLMRKTAEYDHYSQMIPKCIKGMLAELVFDQLPKITAPTLVLFGANDQLIPNKYLHPNQTSETIARTGAAHLPNSTVGLIEKAGHFIQWEQSNKVNQAINLFLVNP